MLHPSAPLQQPHQLLPWPWPVESIVRVYLALFDVSLGSVTVTASVNGELSYPATGTTIHTRPSEPSPPSGNVVRVYSSALFEDSLGSVTAIVSVGAVVSCHRHHLFHPGYDHPTWPLRYPRWRHERVCCSLALACLKYLFARTTLYCLLQPLSILLLALRSELRLEPREMTRRSQPAMALVTSRMLPPLLPHTLSCAVSNLVPSSPLVCRSFLEVGTSQKLNLA